MRRLPLADMAETCTLDVAERDGATLEEVGAVLGVTREYIRIIEGRAVRTLRKLGVELSDLKPERAP